MIVLKNDVVVDVFFGRLVVSLLYYYYISKLILDSSIEEINMNWKEN